MKCQVRLCSEQKETLTATSSHYMLQRLFVEDSDSDIEELQQQLDQQDARPAINLTEENGLGALAHPMDVDEPPLVIEIDQSKPPDEDQDLNLLDYSDEDEVPLYPLIPNEVDSGNDQKPDLKDIRPVNVQLTLALPFQYDMIQSLLITDDPFIIMGKGLGMSNIVANMLHILGTPTKINGVLKRALVIVLNASATDNQQIGEELQELFWLDAHMTDDNEEINETHNNNNLHNRNIDLDNEDINMRTFNVLTADSLSVEQRRQLYLKGGIVSVTSRIFIVDLLSGVVHPNRITGLVILNVETLRNYSNESFITEIYRSQNKWGFIKGFSESPENFTMEFSPLLRRMKDLRFKRVLLWPRFRMEISKCLNKATNTNNVIEVKIQLTNSMLQIQFGLIECLKKCIAELNRKNPELALEWWNIDNALDLNFLKSIDSVMIPNWHRISFESKQLVKDIRFLKQLLELLIVSDAVDFYEEVQISLEANKPSVSKHHSESPWLMLDESQLVISYARKRIYYKDDYYLEEQPKWDQLIHIIDDISHEKLLKPSFGPILVVCSDNATAYQLTQVIKSAKKKNGIRRMLLRKLQMYKERAQERKNLINEVKNKEVAETAPTLNVSVTFAKEQTNSKRRRTRGAAAVATVEKIRSSGAGAEIDSIIESSNFNQELSNHETDEQENEEDLEDSDIEFLQYGSEGDELDNDLEIVEPKKEHIINEDLYKHLIEKAKNERKNKFRVINRNDEIIIDTFNNIDDTSLLQEIMPSHIIMFEPDLPFIRRVELYRATFSGYTPKIFFMYYGESVEEQKHLTSIKREKDSFTKLIKENAQLSHHFETTEDLSHFKNLTEREMKLNKLNRKNTRLAGGQAAFQNFTQDVVIVDTREFNASLPGLLFRYGVRVIPCMLNIGDYIISPDICIERKSVADLIGSLQNNRLNSQCRKMTKFYKYSILLIEFEENQSFSLEPFSERRTYRSSNLSTSHPISSKLAQFEIQAKLAKLVMNFPALRIIWSSSPLQTVNIMLDLKLGREQPDPMMAINLGANTRKNANKDINKISAQEINVEKFSELLKIPGLSKIDYFNIRKRIKSFNKLKKMTLQNLIDITGDNILGTRIYDYLRREEEENNEE